ncbi:MAG TPA: nickel pincer cofactor biosynthesis protein LarC [Desulfosalsimonadaceae bacterium]|nr:nickel pincer cofactor biosynthesis protein LarC [Desulfosalsimonadaceae bacterium]
MLAYFDCFSGISGDMTLGAFFDLGVDPAWLAGIIRDQLGISAEISVSAASRMGISGRAVAVASTDQTPRHYPDIKAMVEKSRLRQRARALSLEMLDRLAAAEARVHQCKKAEVHFHEVGAVDSIVDLVGTALCIEELKINRVVASKIPLGQGTVACAHGTLPVPAPATLEILEGVPTYGSGIEGERVTPTGAAIIRTLADTFGSAPDMVIEKTGYGAGSRENPGLPNLLRVVLGREADAGERVQIVETGIDDMNPELYGWLMERLMAGGALDVWMIPAYMKKNRPGTLLQVLCPLSVLEAIIQCILSETTTIGLRYYNVSRRVLKRQSVTVDTPYGPVAAKQVTLPDGGVRVAPEYEACRQAAQASNVPLQTVYAAACRKVAG